jgi:hypothetical protein|nr:hypothetical protein [uncultured Mediterranean phage uvMED]
MSHTYFWIVTDYNKEDRLAFELFIKHIVDDDQYLKSGTAQCCVSQTRIVFYLLDKALNENQIESIDECMSSM